MPSSRPNLLEWIGRKTPLRQLEIISAADVRRYVDATGDANPLWLDDDFARAAGYRARLLPPTLVGWVPFSFKEGTERARQRSQRSAPAVAAAERIHQCAQCRFGNRVGRAGIPGRPACDPKHHPRHRRPPRQGRLGHLYQPGGTGAEFPATNRPATPPHPRRVSRQAIRRRGKGLRNKCCALSISLP